MEQKCYSSLYPSDYIIYFNNGKKFEFNQAVTSDWKIKRLHNSFYFDTVELNLDFLKTVSEDNLVNKIEEIQEIRDIMNGEKNKLIFTYLTGGEIMVTRHLSSNGESPLLRISWDCNTIYDIKIEKI